MIWFELIAETVPVGVYISKYGFSHTNQPCLGGQDSVCPDPDSYLYWVSRTSSLDDLTGWRVREGLCVLSI